MSEPAPTDVLVVGGGPAGLAAAITVRLAGLSVRVVERAHPPIDKACGEGLMPDGVAVLQGLGVELQQVQPFHGIRYLDGPVIAEGRFPGVCGLGVRRLELHRALVARTAALGIPVDWNQRVLALEDAGVVTASTRLSATWIVAADGLHSSLRHWAGLAGRPASNSRFGVRRHFRVAPWSDCVEVYWADGCEAYVTPVAPDEVGVAILWSGSKANFNQLLPRFPALAARLAGAPSRSRDRGAGPLHQRVRGLVRGRLVLLGDASGYLDAITGEGLSLAFHQAQALVHALVRCDLGAYVRAHRRIAALPTAMTRLLLAVERRPWLRRRVIGALARDPDLFSRLLAVHCRVRPLRSVGLAPLRLLWNLTQIHEPNP